MPPLKIAIQLASLQLPLKSALPLAKRLGASAVEIEARGQVNLRDMSGTALRQLRKMLDDSGLRPAAVGFHTRRGYHVTENLEQRVEATKLAMRFAHGLGASLVVNQVGRVSDDQAGSEWRTLVEVLADLGAYGQHVGATLAAETGSESGPDLRRLLDALPTGSLAVALDPGNLIVNGFSPLEAVAALGRDIWHVHANDAVRDPAHGRGVEVPLGRGTADFPALLGALEEHGYRGYLSIERQGAEDPVGEIAQAVEFLSSL